MKNPLNGLGFPLFAPFEKLHKITIVYNRTTGGEKNEELALTDDDTLEDVRQVKNTLTPTGVKISVFGLDEKNIKKLKNIKTDLIFNLCYGIGNRSDSEKELYEFFDTLKIPYTGGPADAVVLTNDKAATKKLLLKNTIPTPEYLLISSIAELDPVKFRFPLFLKTLDLGCSIGIDQDSVVLDRTALVKKDARLLDKYHKQILIEEFIDGREFAVTVVGNGRFSEVLPVVEILFGPLFDKSTRWKIFDYESKWQINSPFYVQSPYKCPAVLDRNTEDNLKKICLKTYKLCGCRDYARIDVRMDRQNNPFVLEVNLNPSIGRHSQMHKSAMALGLSFRDLIKTVISVSLFRFYGPSYISSGRL